MQFEAGGRPDLADKEKSEIAQLQDYLPAQLSEAEVDAHHQGRHCHHRRSVRQGHGQGHGDREIESRRTCRHGRGERPHQGCSRRLIFLARLRCRAYPGCFALLTLQRSWRGCLRCALQAGTGPDFGSCSRLRRGKYRREQDPKPGLGRLRLSCSSGAMSQLRRIRAQLQHPMIRTARADVNDQESDAKVALGGIRREDASQTHFGTAAAFDGRVSRQDLPGT